MLCIDQPEVDSELPTSEALTLVEVCQRHLYLHAV